MHIHTSDQEKLSLGIGNYSCNWGTHICGLYETEKELDESIPGVVLQTHPFTLNGGIITQNPYYIHPDKWLAEHAPQFLD